MAILISILNILEECISLLTVVRYNHCEYDKDFLDEIISDIRNVIAKLQTIL